MDSFESIIASFLEERGFWVKRCVKVNISQKDKNKIGLPTMPRPEVDLVAFKPSKRELLLIECKSYLDSLGVQYKDVLGIGKGSKRYKLFTNTNFRRIVTNQILKDYKKAGLLLGKVKVNYGLATGKIKPGDENKINFYFKKHSWILYTPREISEMLNSLVNKGYEDNPVVLAAKLILRKTP